MKLKLDENLGGRVAALFREAGHDTAMVPEQGLCSASDRTVIAACQGEGRALVTLDRDFGNRLLFKPAEYHGIAILRPLGKASPERLSVLARTLVKALAQTDIRGKLWIVEMGRIREHEQDS